MTPPTGTDTRLPVAEPAAPPAADQRLSTQPAAVGPPRLHGGRPRPLVAAVRAWRQLTSMRTALLLLFLLAMAAVPGSLLPQNSLNPLKVQAFKAAHPTWAPILQRLSAFDVFAAPWFAAIYLLLFVSLVGCLVPRIRLHARALLRTPPAAPARPSRLPHGARWSTALPPAETVAAGEAVLRRRRYRLTSTAETFSAEKGYLRETGNLLFHVALVVLLAGIGFGSAFGYQGTVLTNSGDGFSNALVSYDQFKAGRLIDSGRLRPFSMTLDDFEATYQDNGSPKDFDAHVSYTTGSSTAVRHDDIKVNHPLTIGSASVYLIGHGYSPHFVLKDRTGKVVWDAYVPCTPRNPMFASTCTVKIPDTGLPATGSPRTPQQLAFTGVLTPTTEQDPAQGFVSTYPALRAPGLTLTAFVGNLHLDEGVPQNVYELDRTDLRQVPVDGPLGTGKVAQVLAVNNPAQRTISGLPGGMSLEVDGIHQFATFQVKSDPYKSLVLIAAVLIIIGLITSLRVRRRRLWLRATPGADGRTLVEMGGLTRSDAEGFATEFGRLAREVHARTAPSGGEADGPRVPSGGEADGPRVPSGGEADGPRAQPISTKQEE